MPLDKKIGIYPALEELFKSLRKNRKGNEISDIFKQLFCFLADGTSRHITRFDELKKDDVYAAGIHPECCIIRSKFTSNPGIMFPLIPFQVFLQQSQ